MLAFLWLTGALLAAALRAVRRLGPPGGMARALAAAGLAALAGFYLDGFVQNNFGDSQAALLFWLAAGVVIVCGRSPAVSGPKVAGAPA
jgi:hypothetical protein